jgi:chromosomal replication initiator protein
VFHTFQALFDEGKQIILASDRPPKDINPLEERLRSRFEQGLLADLNPPDMELRVAILRKKAETLDIDLPDDVLNFLAENLRSNIRQIEGAIKKLAAKSLVDGRRISMELARECVTDYLGDAEPLSVTIDKIFAAVFKKCNVQREELVGKKRNKEIANARHIAIYLIREITEMSYPNISKIFDRDHATIMASIEVVKKRISSDAIYSMDIEGLKKEICGN